MHFHHLHFYVNDAAFWQEWFIEKLAFRTVSGQLAEVGCEDGAEGNRDRRSTTRRHQLSRHDRMHDDRTHGDRTHGYRTLRQGEIEIRLSDAASSAEVERYLQQHPPGVADVAFATDSFETVLERAIAQGARLARQVSGSPGQRQCQLTGWANLRHTLIETSQAAEISQVQTPGNDAVNGRVPQTAQSLLSAIDHVVLNVAKGQMALASDWYQRVFGLAQGQRFEIMTANSGLCSQVLVHPQGSLQLPINEPSSANSQIQEFLNHNRGAGIQHAALRSLDAVSAIAHFRQQGLQLIGVPGTYYEGLKSRLHCPLSDIRAVSAQQLLLDWATDGKQGALLQTFTQPIFAEPTFFFEIIERGTYRENGQIKNAQGFGEGNFQALFEAIERAQLGRGSLR